MNKNVIAAVSAMCVMGAATVVTAGPALAAKGDPAAPGSETTTWEMPDLEGMILHPALKSILSATGGKQVSIKYVDAGHLPVYNDENWMVCGQSPAAGAETAKYSVTLKVERPAFDECPSS